MEKRPDRVVLSEALPAPAMARLAAAGLDVVVLPAPTEAALAAAITTADAVVLVNETPCLTAAAIEGAPRLRLACRNGAGVDNFARDALTRRGIPLATTGAANADAVAEHALALLLAVAKRGPAYDRAAKAGRWIRAARPMELRGKTAAIVGHGRIGRRIARLCAAFGMAVVVVDPRAGPSADGFPVLALDDALARADAAILSLPLTAATHHLIDAAALARMKPAAILVNVARGPVVDQRALLAALENGRLAGAGLDVLEAEPPDPADPLLVREDVVLSPHVAASTAEAVLAVAMACADAVIAGLAGRLDPAAVVNPEALARS